VHKKALTAGSLLLSILGLHISCGRNQQSWEQRTKLEAIRILEGIVSTNELHEAVGHSGVALTLTNGSWIAIRVVFDHEETSREVSIAHDSEGGWFEGTRKFSGRLSWYVSHKEHTPAGGVKVTTSECFILEDIESAPSLTEARELMVQHLDFVSFEP
jgi:hypothetical protein